MEESLSCFLRWVIIFENHAHGFFLSYGKKETERRHKRGQRAEGRGRGYFILDFFFTGL